MVKIGKTGRQYNGQKSNLKTGRQYNGQKSNLKTVRQYNGQKREDGKTI